MKRKDKRDRREYYLANKEKINARAILWAKNNKERRKEIVKRYHKNNPTAKIAYQLRSRMYNVLKENIKSAPFIDLVGLPIEHLITYLESKFQEGMNWNNYGVHGWHIDHIKPCSSFDLTDPEQQRHCFHYTNLQPLWAKDNRKKYNKYEG